MTPEEKMGLKLPLNAESRITYDEIEALGKREAGRSIFEKCNNISILVGKPCVDLLDCQRVVLLSDVEQAVKEVTGCE